MALAPERNPILSKISVAAHTVLNPTTHREISSFIGAGPSIRARARLALVAAFLVAAPTLFIGVVRTEKVADQAAVLSELDSYWKEILHVRLIAQDLDLALLTHIFEGELGSAQLLLTMSEKFKASVNKLVSRKPRHLDFAIKDFEDFFEGLANRLDVMIKRSVAENSSLAPARLSLITLREELARVEKSVALVATREKKRATFLFSTVSRDQLILFLILLFGMPIFVGFVPSWIATPLRRLRRISSKIEAGQIKEMAVTGRDEVATLARTLKSYFLRKEELDNKKSSKIFELRNVVRAVINRVLEPVFVVDANSRINYTNEAAAKMLGLPVHRMEGNSLSDCMYSPMAQKAVEKSFRGDVTDEAIALTIEPSDGKERSMLAKIGVVRNRDGEVSRAVLVLYDNDSLAPNVHD